MIKKKPSRKNLIRRLDNLVRKIVLERTPHCVLAASNCSPVLQAGHIFSRSHYATRWDLTNVWTQCSSHNLLHERDQWPFFSWFQSEFGPEKFEELRAKHYQLTHYKSSDLLALLDQLGGKGK